MKALIATTLLLFAVPAFAQAADYNLRIYLPGATAPTSTTTLLTANVVCNQVAPTTTSTKNPNKAVFDDPAVVGRVCIWTDPGTGPLIGTPTGFAAYEATMTMVQGGVESDESNRAPFSQTPGPLRNVRLVR